MRRSLQLFMVSFLTAVSAAILNMSSFAQNMRSSANDSDTDESKTYNYSTISSNDRERILSLNSGYNWTRIDSVNISAHILKIRKSNNNLLVGYWDNRGVWQYNDSSKSWNCLYAQPLERSHIEDLEELNNDSTNLYIGIDCDGGFNYKYKSNTLTQYTTLGSCVEKLFYVKVNNIDYILASTWSNGVLASTNNGNTWITIFNEPQGRIWSFTLDDHNNILMGGCHGLYRTYDLIGFDTLYSLQNKASYNAIWDISFNEKDRFYLLATTSDGLLKSYNLVNWFSCGFSGISLHSIYFDSKEQIYYIGAGERLNTNGQTGGVYIGTAQDSNWVFIGLDKMSIQSIVGDGNNIYAGVADFGTWKLNLCAKFILVRHDTIKYGGKDTVYLFNRIQHDTAIVKSTDTVIIQTVVHDTTIVYDTLKIKVDSLIYTSVYDTLYQYDTIYITKYVTIYDTVYIDVSTGLKLIVCNDTLKLTTNGLSYTIAPNPIQGNRIDVFIASNVNKTIKLALINENENVIGKFSKDIVAGMNVVPLVFNSVIVSGNYFLVVSDPDLAKPFLMQVVVRR